MSCTFVQLHSPCLPLAAGPQQLGLSLSSSQVQHDRSLSSFGLLSCRYQVCKNIALQKADSNPDVCKALGQPLATGPWYNARWVRMCDQQAMAMLLPSHLPGCSLGLTHRGHIAQCQLTVIGQKSSSDIYMRVSLSSHNGNGTCARNTSTSKQGRLLLLQALRSLWPRRWPGKVGPGAHCCTTY